MKRQRPVGSDANGFALVYMSVVLAGLVLFSGLAVDSGRAYVVKAQLTKAVDGAALGAARNLNSGDPRAEAAQIFTANFPVGFMGTTSVTNPSDPSFFSLTTNETTAVNIVTVTASAVLPTSFMKLGGFNTVTVTSSGEATRRMVDLSLVLDVSSSIGSKWPSVRDAARTFIDSFDQVHDRVALMLFSNGSTVLDQMPSTRGFDKPKTINDVPQYLPGGSTLMVEGLYHGWDELKTVPSGTQSSLRVIVLFTDGASNGVPGNYGTGESRSLRTYDFPKNATDPDGQTWNQPILAGLYDAQTGIAYPSLAYQTTPDWRDATPYSLAPLLPATTWHTHNRSAGIPTSFPLQSSTLRVNGSAQSSVRGLRNVDAGTGRYPSDVWNTNNAARNVLEIIADAARTDTGGDYRIRIYTIGMGYLLRDLLGTMPEMPEDILKRVSNDKRSPDFNNAQLEGKYFYAETAADVSPAFQGIQNEILRLSK